MNIELKFLRGQRVYFVGGTSADGGYVIASAIVESVSIGKQGVEYVLSDAKKKEHELFATAEGIDLYLRESDSKRKSLQEERPLAASDYMNESVKNWVNGIPEGNKKERDSNGRFTKK